MLAWLPVYLFFRLFWKKCIAWKKGILWEKVDIDDVILNFLGGCLGAGVHFAIRKCVPDVEKLAR